MPRFLILIPIIFIGCSNRYLIDPRQDISELRQGNKIEILKDDGKKIKDKYKITENDTIICKKNKISIRDINTIEKISISKLKTASLIAVGVPAVVVGAYLIMVGVVYIMIFTGYKSGA